MNEFTVVLYAGGTDRLSSDLSLPKALLPVGNRPLIWYTIQLIQSDPTLSSSPLLILTSNSSRQILDEYLSTLNLKYEIVLYRPQHDSTGDDQHVNSDQMGTLDILRCCYSKIRTESICLLPADLFGKISFAPMINSFRIRDASLMMLLISIPPTKEAMNQPGQKMKFIQEPEYYSIDPSKEIVTSIRFKADLEEHLPMKRNILIKHPRTRIRADLVDAHLYLIKKSALDIAIASKYSSFRKEFLPKMIRQCATGQNIEDLVSSSSSNQQKYLLRQKTADYDDYANLTKVLQTYQSGNENIHQGCFYTIADQQLFRVKHVIAYLEANRQASTLISSYTSEDINFKDRLEQVQISADCVIGDGAEIGKRTTIKRTIIGKNCRIEDKCKIVNSVLLDNVTLKEGTTIQNSILCSRSIMGNKCEILNSIVCANQQVEANKKLSSETISTETDDGETFDLYDNDDDQH